MAALDQSAAHEVLRRSYGGSDNTSASFLRPQYVKYNGVAKSRELGVVDNLFASVNGLIGSQAGASTLFLKVITRGPSRIGISRTPINAYTDRFVSVGLLDGNRDQLPLDHTGFAYQHPVHNHGTGLAIERLPAGTYFFTISCDQWQSVPFEVDITVQRFVLLAGATFLDCQPTLRIALVKPEGIATGSLFLSGSTVPRALLKALEGAASSTAVPRLTLAIMSGAAIGTLAPYGRLKQTFRIEGVASGSSPSIATMTVTRQPGYEY
jgi:hypothetical protein